MGVQLKKGQGVSLKKNDYDLSNVTIGLGWDINEDKQHFLGQLLGSHKAQDYDLDVVAFLCGANGKVNNLGCNEQGQATLLNSDVIFFNNMRHYSDCIWLTGDNRTGAGDGDDEQMIVKLNTLPVEYSKVIFVVQIYQGLKNNQNFGRIKNAFIRAVDGRQHEMVRFDLSGGKQYEHCRSLLFAELARSTDGWLFNAIGKPSPADSFVEWLKHYT